MAAPIADAPEIKIENDGGENNEQNQENIQHNFAGRGRGRGGGPGGFRGGPNRRPGGPFRGGRGGGGFRNDFHGRRGGGPPMGGRGGGNNPNDGEDGPRGLGGQGRFVDKIVEKLANMNGPTFDLPPLDTAEKKFSGRTRLYIGNIVPDTDENELREFFSQYGETSEYFMNKDKNFAFVRFDYRANAEKAKRELDGCLLKGRNVKIRFAPNGSTIKVKNLTHFVSNELLYHAFSVFGEVERAYIIVDDRGKSSGEGIVEFTRKGFALNAIRKCSEGCFFLTASLRPCIVESFEPADDIDGLQDKYLPRKNMDFNREREIGPRFGNLNSFETRYGDRWKELYELYAQKEAALKKEFEMDKEKLEAQMHYARYEHETEMLREQLRSREMDRDRQKHEWEMKEKMAEEQRQRSEEQMRRQQEEMQGRIVKQEEDMRRRQQENNLFMQAHQLDNMLEQQEQQQQTFEPPPNNFNSNNEDGDNRLIMEPKAFMNSFKRNNQRFEGRGDMGPGGPRNGGGRGHWVNNSDNRRDDFPSKRRRF